MKSRWGCVVTSGPFTLLAFGTGVGIQGQDCSSCFVEVLAICRYPYLVGNWGALACPLCSLIFCIWNLFLSTLLGSPAYFPGSCLPWSLRFQGQCISQPWSGEKAPSLVLFSLG